jgi:hypothetical protein
MESRVIAAIFVFMLLIFFPKPTLAAEIGDVITCPDFSSVYYIAEDGRRHVFPNENVYKSWHEDFDDVKVISCEDMAEMPLGDLVQYQAGTSLIKTQYNPHVYAVEPDGKLKTIKDEDQAELLYGSDWATTVDDIPETFFSKYEVEGELQDGEIPAGMIFVDENGDLFRALEDGSVVEIDDVITEETEEMFEKFAIRLEAVEEKLQDLHSLAINVKELKDEMEAIFNEIMPMMKTVSVASGLEAPSISFEELFENELEMQENYDDIDSDGIIDFWDEKDDYWQANDVSEDWYDENYNTWVDEGYHEYYNEYYEVFEGEEDFSEWKEGRDTKWKDFDYDPFIDEKWDNYEDWSSDENGWSGYKEDWDIWSEAEILWEENGFDYEVPDSFFVHDVKTLDDGMLMWYWFDDGYIAESNEAAWNHCLIYGPGTASGIAWQCEALYGQDYLDPENVGQNPVVNDAYYTFYNGHLISNDLEAEQYCSGFKYGGDALIIAECESSFGIVFSDDDTSSATGSVYYTFNNGHIVSSHLEAEQYCSGFRYGVDNEIIFECSNSLGIYFVDETDDSTDDSSSDENHDESRNSTSDNSTSDSSASVSTL